MATNCPYCRARVAPATLEPGRHRLSCPHCHKPFALTVPIDARLAWRARAVPDETTRQTRPGQVAPPVAGHLTHHGHGGGAEARGGTVVASESIGASLAQTPTPQPISDPPRAYSPLTRAVPRPPAGSVPEEDAGSPARPPSAVPGYSIESTLGFGGMGTVYLARQISLDRPVALKVMSRRWSRDPVFVARFTREAFAAALLNHPNVVQIYDIGEAEGQRFFSMEYVPGQSLAGHIKAVGKLDPETAVGYVLQAARGLKHAHDRGMIHRDVKPDNLLLNEQGVVKVADLGLVKTPEMRRGADAISHSSGGSRAAPATMTGAKMALGTPAYMAPEQCRDASAVDHRADIYSLGCTLYVLVTGRPPFEGSTAVELMTKHAYEPIVPPELLVNRVPKELSAVILRMLAKSADDRFANMAEVIRTLEQWLGIHHAGTFSPREEHIDLLEKQVREFNGAPAAVLKGRLLTAGLSAVLLAAVLLMFFGRLGWAFGLAGMVLQAALAHFVVDGVANKTFLFRRARRLVVGLTAWDFVLLAAGVGLFALLLWMTGIFWLWLGFGCLGAAAAFGVRLGLDRAVEAERAGPLEAAQKLLRRMRLNGLGEEELRLFAAKYAGRDWEEFFEALFGYEAKLSARALLLRGGSAGVRERFAAWREPLVNLIDRVERGRKEARERQLLQLVERASLLATGVDAGAAQTRAHASADTLMHQAEAARRADAAYHEAGHYPGMHTAVMMPNLGQILAAHAAQNPTARPAKAPRDWAGAAVNLFVGPHVRTVASATLMAACALWVHQNRGFFDPTSRVAAEATAALAVEGLPAAVTAWCDSANAGWAGVLLLASLFFQGNRMGLLVLLGAGICAFGHRFGIRTVEPIRDYHVAMLLGSVFTLVGFRLGRR